MKKEELKEFLDKKYVQYNTLEYIESDPIQVPHLFSEKMDIEIASFLTATIAWGNRKSIIKNAKRMMLLLDNAPSDFIINAEESDIQNIEKFVHRTFQPSDFSFFLLSLQNIYKNHNGLEVVFSNFFSRNRSMKESIEGFHKLFFELPHEIRTQKHVANPAKGSSAKRINMFLRWMVRKDAVGVDFGIWNKIPTNSLCVPLDVHVGNVARRLDLLKRKQNDWNALEELMGVLRTFDHADPCKYDYSLFGLGVFEGFGR